jgi:hypothetical protein
VLAIHYWGQEPQDCKILTLGNSDHGLTWRDAGHPPVDVVSHVGSLAVVNGFMFFRSDHKTSNWPHPHQEIMVFDLCCETWWPATSFRGPPISCCLSLAELNGHLVACYIHYFTSIEMWFLEDLHMSDWSKRYTIEIPRRENINSRTCYVVFVKPLAVLDDGRIVLWLQVWTTIENDLLLIYDPRTNKFLDETKLPECSSVSVFAWNLLHSGRKSAIDMAAERLLIGRRHH